MGYAGDRIRDRLGDRMTNDEMRQLLTQLAASANDADNADNAQLMRDSLAQELWERSAESESDRAGPSSAEWAALSRPE